MDAGIDLINIKINDASMELDRDSSLSDVIEKLSLKERSGLAIAVNSVVVSKKDWNSFILHNDDEVLIIEAAQGG